jgi:hypothetical protein
LSDAEYRDALQMIAGVTTSTDKTIGDRHLDKLLSYFEAIYWRKIDAKELSHAPRPYDPFRARNYWASKNTAASTSRDRHIAKDLVADIQSLEEQLNDLGYHAGYCQKILDTVLKGGSRVPNAHQLSLYRAALQRTLTAKKRKDPHAQNCH